MAKALIGIALSLCLGLSFAHAQTAKQAPTWGQLTQEQQRILAPIQGEWEKLDPPHKRKWLGIAQRYPKMKREAQERLQRRMQEWASLTPAQRQAAREKYKEFEQLPAEERQAVRKKWEEYKEARAAQDAQKAAEPPGEEPAEGAAASDAPGEKPSESAASEAAPSEAAAPPPQ
jgi:hypothetical protein